MQLPELFSCSEAMKKLQSQDETDLIILDIPNDTSDNYKLLQHISTSSVLSNIRTVVISNSDDPSLKHKTAELGVSLFLQNLLILFIFPIKFVNW